MSTVLLETIIDAMHTADWVSVRSIYSEGVTTGQATFETEAGDWASWNDAHMPAPRLVARDTERVLGWAALSPVSGRCVYGGVADVSVYVAVSSRGKGIGAKLLRGLIAASEREGIWTLQAGIFPENGASVALHRACGFREVGRRERLGQLHGVWRDVLIFERRSRSVGQ
jgi:phosphinothricin acetyltransferase